jgi:hypothetical protein
VHKQKLKSRMEERQALEEIMGRGELLLSWSHLESRCILWSQNATFGSQ